MRTRLRGLFEVFFGKYFSELEYAKYFSELDLSRVYYQIKLSKNARQYTDPIYSSSSVNSIDSRWNCAEGVCWPCYIGGNV